MAQKACSFLASALNNDNLKIGVYHNLFDSMKYALKPSQSFLEFITMKDGKKNFGNLELLLEMEKKYPGIFTKVMTSFDKAKLYKEALDKDGKPITISWENALRAFYLSNKYIGITDETEDIARVFAERGISQEIFDEAKSIREKNIKNDVKDHILGESLKEETILESIEKLREQIDGQLLDSKKIVDDLYDKQFTYEWLNKNDPRNFIIGLYCTCCATITSNLYGKNIAISSIESPDVQNIVVKDSKGEIISKGTMYINRKMGYAVINDFEMNRRYRNHEEGIGEYSADKNSKEEKERILIFKAFQRGINDFVKKYNEKNPDKPIKQVNVGMGYNRLKAQVENFKKAKHNLDVPSEYCFRDTETNQYILYNDDKVMDTTEER